MNKIITFFCMTSVILNEKFIATTETPKKSMDCTTAYDCPDSRMICQKNRTCGCANFHDFDSEQQRCVVNVSRIYRWLKATMSTEPEGISQQEDFDAEQRGNLTILYSKWREYSTEEEIGIVHTTRVIWPILLGVVIILFVYGAILLEWM